MSKFRKGLTDNAGFTLIELLVVIAVLGILAGIAVPRLSGVTDKAKDSAIATFAGAINTGMEMYYVENNNSYPTADENGINNTIETLRSTLDTITDNDDLGDYNIDTFTYEVDSDSDRYLFSFDSLNDDDSSDPDYDYYLGDLGASAVPAEATSGGSIN